MCAFLGTSQLHPKYKELFWDILNNGVNENDSTNRPLSVFTEILVNNILKFNDIIFRHYF